jgi:hypothetical protein
MTEIFRVFDEHMAAERASHPLDTGDGDGQSSASQTVPQARDDPATERNRYELARTLRELWEAVNPIEEEPPVVRKYRLRPRVPENAVEQSTFFLFNKLPSEIRMMIWAFSLPDLPQKPLVWTCTLRRQTAIINNPDVKEAWHEDLVPTAFHVSQEARSATILWMAKHGLELKMTDEPNRTFTMLRPFDPERDMVYIADDCFRTIPHHHRQGRSHARIRPETTPSSVICQAQTLVIEAGTVAATGIRVWDENNFFPSVKKTHVIMRNDLTEADDPPSGELEGQAWPRHEILGIFDDQRWKTLKERHLDIANIATFNLSFSILHYSARLGGSHTAMRWMYCETRELDDWFEVV